MPPKKQRRKEKATVVLEENTEKLEEDSLPDALVNHLKNMTLGVHVQACWEDLLRRQLPCADGCGASEFEHILRQHPMGFVVSHHVVFA